MSNRRKLPFDIPDALPEEVVPAPLPIHLKYRPAKLEDMHGQQAVVKSLGKVLADKSAPHSFLFTGPSGTGKTTLSRIVGHSMGIDASNVLEMDAATNNGVDDMRAITGILHYKGFGSSPRKLIIVDECHQLTKQAWQSLLKAVEEPPEHIYFAFCTTEPGKVPETIRTRCTSYNLQPVKYDNIMDLLELVRDQEGYNDTPLDVLKMIARACNGSPRQALVMLSSVQGVKDLDEVALLLAEPSQNKEVIDLCRMLVSDKLDWNTLTKTLKAMPEQNPESIRIVVVNYLAAVLMNAKGDKDAVRLLDMLGCFCKPFNQSDKMAPLLLAFGAYIYP